MYTKYTYKIDTHVHIFATLVYKICTKFDPKTTVPSKILIQNDYTKWIQNEHTRLYALVYKIGTNVCNYVQNVLFWNAIFDTKWVHKIQNGSILYESCTCFVYTIW